MSGFFGKSRGRAAEARRSALSLCKRKERNESEGFEPHMKWCPRLIVLVAIGSLLPMLLTVQAQRSKRLVEAVEVVGNRRLSAKDILSHIKTRPGEPFSAKQSKLDLQELLALGVFDKMQTRVTMESGSAAVW